MSRSDFPDIKIDPKLNEPFENLPQSENLLQKRLEKLHEEMTPYTSKLHDAIAAIQIETEPLVLSLNSMFIAIQADLDRFQEPLRLAFETAQTASLNFKIHPDLLHASLLKEGGWVSHCSMSSIPDETFSSTDISASLLAYYKENWATVRRDIENRLGMYSIDDETKKAFEEILTAHKQKLYRCTVRTLFPEIERVARYSFPDFNPAKSFASLKEIREKAGELTTPEMGVHGFHAYLSYLLLDELSYINVEKDTLKKIEETKIPNRHAALHGLVPYNTEQHSLNAIFLGEHILQIITAIKHLPETSAK